MPKQLIALVATAVIVDGARRVIQPGQPLPELAAKDAAELAATNAAAQTDAPDNPAAEKEPTESPKKARGKS